MCAFYHCQKSEEEEEEEEEEEKEEEEKTSVVVILVNYAEILYEQWRAFGYRFPVA
jgi:hypothetical protein